MDLSVQGIGIVAAIGSGVDRLQAALNGERQPVTVRQSLLTRSGECELVVLQPQYENIDEYLPKRAQRRLDGITKSAVLASLLAIEDSGIELQDRSRLGIAFGTANGPLRTTFNLLDTIIEEGDSYASPTQFAASVHNTMASQASILLGCTGPVITVTAAQNTVVETLRTASLWLEQGYADYILAGFGDEYCDVCGYYAASEGKAPSEQITSGSGFVTLLLTAATGRNSGYGILSRPEFIALNDGQATESLRDHRSLFCTGSAAGLLKETAGQLPQDQLPVVSHSSLTGVYPTDIGIELAAAALSLKELAIRIPPEAAAPGWAAAQTVPLQAPASIACLERATGDGLYLYQLSRS